MERTVTIRTISIADGIAFVTAEHLTFLDDTGHSCEICDSPMNQHEWVLMDPNGFCVGVCSISTKEILKREKGKRIKP
jgi:hypothetical protein